MKKMHKIINLLNSCTKKTRLNCEQGSINLRLYKSVKNDTQKLQLMNKIWFAKADENAGTHNA